MNDDTCKELEYYYEKRISDKLVFIVDYDIRRKLYSPNLNCIYWFDSYNSIQLKKYY